MVGRLRCWLRIGNWQYPIPRKWSFAAFAGLALFGLTTFYALGERKEAASPIPLALPASHPVVDLRPEGGTAVEDKQAASQITAYPTARLGTVDEMIAKLAARRARTA